MKLHGFLSTAVVAGILLQCGTALTASSNAPAQAAGFGSGAISGVTAESISYGTDGPNIDVVRLVLAGDTTGTRIEIAFNGDSPTPCTDRGRYNGTSATTYHCEIVQSLADATEFALVAR